jgi:hypothetical protein
VDSVLNHCLIDRATNIRIGKAAPSVYLAEIRAALGSELDRVLRSQRLPTGPRSPLLDDDYDGFLSWRIGELTEALAEEAGVSAPRPEELDPQRARLDARVEAVELRLRRIVLEGVRGDEALLPPLCDAEDRRAPYGRGSQAPGRRRRWIAC